MAEVGFSSEPLGALLRVLGVCLDGGADGAEAISTNTEIRLFEGVSLIGSSFFNFLGKDDRPAMMTMWNKMEKAKMKYFFLRPFGSGGEALFSKIPMFRTFPRY